MSKISTRDASTISTMLSTEQDFRTHGALQGKRRLNGDYVVYSYAEPILKITGGRVEVATRKFSVTTSRHQGTIRYAASLAGLDPYTVEVDRIFAP